MNRILAPSILSADFSKLGQELKDIKEGGAQWLHFDVMDGLFVPSISFGQPVLKSIKPYTDLFVDAHLMIVDPERYVEGFAAAGADLITIHLEATKDIPAVLEQIKALGVKAGLAINPGTAFSEAIPYLEQIDMLLIMSVNPGFGGQKLIEHTLDKMKEADAYRKAHGLSYILEIDGGVNKENIQTVVDTGVDAIVAGSAVFKENTKENAKYFADAIK